MKSFLLAVVLSVITMGCAHAQYTGGSSSSSKNTGGGSSAHVSACQQLENVEAENGVITGWTHECQSNETHSPRVPPVKAVDGPVSNTMPSLVYGEFKAHYSLWDYVMAHPRQEYVLVIEAVSVGYGGRVSMAMTEIDHFETEKDCQASADYALKRRGISNAFCLLRPHHPVP